MRWPASGLERLGYVWGRVTLCNEWHQTDFIVEFPTVMKYIKQLLSKFLSYTCMQRVLRIPVSLGMGRKEWLKLHHCDCLNITTESDLLPNAGKLKPVKREEGFMSSWYSLTRKNVSLSSRHFFFFPVFFHQNLSWLNKIVIRLSQNGKKNWICDVGIFLLH